MIEVRDIDADTNSSTHHTGGCCLHQVLILLLIQSLNAERDDHCQHDEQIIVGHLHLVRQHLQSSKECRHQHTPQVFATIGQHHTRNHRRQVGQRHHFPDMSGSNDNKEIAAERPDDSSQSRQIDTEVEGTQQNIEA